MFETSFVESSSGRKSMPSRYMLLTGAFNATVVAVMMLMPLLHPQALPKSALAAMLTAPPPPAASAPTPRPITAVSAAKAAPTMDAFTAPSQIPTRIDTAHEDAPPPTSGTGVVSMIAVASDSLGPAGAIGFGAPAPVTKVALPRVATTVHISSGVIAGNKLSGSSPIYPPIAKAAHVSGAVVLHAIISRTGTIQSLSVVSGPEMLRANAVAAVQEWKYKPYMLNGEPTEVETSITVNFSFGG